MGALGSTNAPVDSSSTSGVDGEDGLLANTTLAKWVGTLMLGGEPITSCVYSLSWAVLKISVSKDIPHAICHPLLVEANTEEW
jgi:hypothetical protein